MKKLYQRLSYILIALYILGVFYLGYYLYALPENISVKSTSISLEELASLGPVFSLLYFIAGTTLLIGLLSFVFLLLGSQGAEKQNIVYVEKVKKEEDTTEEDNDEEQSIAFMEKEIEDIKASTNDPKQVWEKTLHMICRRYEASQGAVYLFKQEGEARFIELFVSYAFILPESKRVRYELGEGLAGQVAKEGVPLMIDDIPEGYLTIRSGLGASDPSKLLIQPLKDDDNVFAVAEVASFKEIPASCQRDITEAFTLIKDMILQKKAKK